MVCDTINSIRTVETQHFYGEVDLLEIGLIRRQ